MTQKQRAFRVDDDLWAQITARADEANISVNAWMTEALKASVSAGAATSVAGAPSADTNRDHRFATLVSHIGPTAGYPYHEHEQNVKDTIVREGWVRHYRLPFTEADIVAACYAAGEGDPWRGFIEARVREQLNDELDGVGSRPAVLRARLKDIARVNR